MSHEEAMNAPLQDIKYRNGGMVVSMLGDEPEEEHLELWGRILFGAACFLAGMLALSLALLTGYFDLFWQMALEGKE